jgi:hypothetical protein
MSSQETQDANSLLVEQEHIYDKIFEFTNTDSTGTSSLVWQLISNFRFGRILFVIFTNCCSIGMDISAVTCPTFLIRPVSMLEIAAEAVKPLDDLSEISTLDSPLERILRISKSFLHCCTLAPQKHINHCKPYNPIFGERFHCSWEHSDGSTTKFYGEQVSHHPPISACYWFNEKANLRSQFVTKPGTYFRGNYAEVDMVGKDHLTITNLDEEYTITIPPTYCCGIVWGTSRVEHGKSFEIACKKTGLRSLIEFTSGSNIYGKVTLATEELATFSGDVFGKVTLNGGKEFYSYESVKLAKKIVKPVVEQDPMESRYVWHHATYALVKHQDEQSQKAKHEVEEHQRALRKQGLLPSLKWFKATGETTEEGVPCFEYIGPQE